MTREGRKEFGHGFAVEWVQVFGGEGERQCEDDAIKLFKVTTITPNTKVVDPYKSESNLEWWLGYIERAAKAYPKEIEQIKKRTEAITGGRWS